MLRRVVLSCAVCSWQQGCMWSVEEFCFHSCVRTETSVQADDWHVSNGLSVPPVYALKLKIHCSTPERHPGTEWKTESGNRRQNPQKVSALPRWCACTYFVLNKTKKLWGALVSQPHRLALAEYPVAVWHRCSRWRLMNAQICDCHISSESLVALELAMVWTPDSISFMHY